MNTESKTEEIIIEDKQYKSNYNKYLGALTLDNVANKLMSSTFLVGYAIFLGLSDIMIGIYVALKSIMRLTQIFAAPLFSKIGQSKKVTLTVYSLYRIFGAIPIFIPFITQDITLKTVLFMTCMFFYQLFGELAYTPLVNWKMSIIKQKDRSKFYAIKNFLQNTLVMGLSLGAGVLLDRYAEVGNEFKGFFILFAFIFIVNITDIFIRACTYKPIINEEKVNIKEAVKQPLKDLEFKKILIFTALYTLSLNIGIQYLSLFQLKYMEISYTFVSLLNIILALASAFSGVLWMKLYNKYGWKKIGIPMLVAYILMFVLLGCINTNMKFILFVIFILYGIGESAYVLIDNNVIYESAKDKYKTAYISVNKTFCGIISILVPIITSFIMQDENNTDNIKFVFLVSVVMFVITVIYYKKNLRNMK